VAELADAQDLKSCGR